MGDYTKKIFVCPFYTSNAKGVVRCEGGNISFPDRELSREYFDSFCASYEWGRCSIAKALVNFYEKSNTLPADGRRKRIVIGGYRRNEQK